MTDAWTISEPDLPAAFRRGARPLELLADGSLPAIVLRGVYPKSACENLVRRLVAAELLYDPHQPLPDKFRQEAIPEGYYREGRNSVPSQAFAASHATGRTRIDVGTSLGYRGSDPEGFFAHSRQTHELFARLFPADDNPVQLVYDYLRQLAVDKPVETAYEPDGRRYGPAIIRAHYGGYTYQPHFDSVRLREKRSDYAVHRFSHQFAGVLVLQNASREGRSAQGILHHCLWQPEVDPHLKDGTFHEYAREHGIENVEVCLEPGDLYFFNTRSIHEVPGVDGDLPRIVLATFIGFDPDDDEILVWS